MFDIDSLTLEKLNNNIEDHKIIISILFSDNLYNISFIFFWLNNKKYDNIAAINNIDKKKVFI